MIDREDSIVTLSYRTRDLFGTGDTEQTVALVGTPESIGLLVASHVQGWLDRGATGPLTLTTVAPMNVIDADARAEEKRRQNA